MLEIQLRLFLLGVYKLDVVIPDWFLLHDTLSYWDYFVLLCIMQKYQLNSSLI